ncbi:Surface polysaccharide O-acyltransferase, integral membrane enzyme [Fibrobacter intestinalis]|uniref:Surface polysaccharide O-acyltransferase, integral membrane enzyme n=1 Tax=Fibrobacter intestinalis TaxID=28122 RepID=A0A1M6PSZ0_9BACT|nr:acyltransferase [Fibrobacter intestinalis]SHK11114.1 Surface polysaccharide O-acyltransferase, integral membrane enzyme [Fibrobacter intestinalis]
MPRIHYFNLLNIFACINVIALHCNAYSHSFAHNSAWHQAIIFEVVFFAAVPIFFMLSGATLFSFKERYTTKDFYKKRIRRTFFPYLIFSIILYILFLYKNFHDTGSFYLDLHHFFSTISTGQIPFSNYWFFIPLFLFYLFLPFLEKIVNHSSLNALTWLCIFVFFFQSCVPLINLFGDFNITKATPISGYCIYAILGFVLNKTNLEKRWTNLLWLGIITLCVFIIRYLGILSLDHRDTLWFSYFGFYAVIPAIFFFLTFKRLNPHLDKHPQLAEKIKQLSSLSFGIYLIHGVVLTLLPFEKSSISYRILGIPLVYGSCAFFIYFGKKIPLLKRIIP